MSLYDMIDRHLDREIDAIEQSIDDPVERARAIREAERDARWAYQDERERGRWEQDQFERDFG